MTQFTEVQFSITVSKSILINLIYFDLIQFDSTNDKLSISLLSHLNFNVFYFTKACDCQHANVNPFIGACIEPGNIFLLTEYCNKGSLQVWFDNFLLWKCANLFQSFRLVLLKILLHLAAVTYLISLRPGFFEALHIPKYFEKPWWLIQNPMQKKEGYLSKGFVRRGGLFKTATPMGMVHKRHCPLKSPLSVVNLD